MDLQHWFYLIVMVLHSGQLLEDDGIWNFSAESDNYQDMRRKLVYVHKQNPGLKPSFLPWMTTPCRFTVNR